jgi:hypothetical protein
MKSRRWILRAFSVFLLLLFVWVAAAFLLNAAFAESLPFSLSLRSKLAANYEPDALHGKLGVFRLSIIEDALRDRGISDEEAEEKSKEIMIAMSSPVPTATARDFEGEDPFTPTATQVPDLTSTEDLTPSSTTTGMVSPLPSQTVTKTPTPNTTGTATAFVTPSKTPSPTRCWVDPVIEILEPADGSVFNDGQFIPAQAFAYDPDNVDPGECKPIGVYPSDDGAGIIEVEFKIKWIDGGGVIVYSSIDTAPTYCGFGGVPCSYHPVSNPTWPGGATKGPGLHKLEARAKDDGGNYSTWDCVYFTLNLSATATPTPILPTATDTLTPSNTPIPPTSTFTPTPPTDTDTPVPPTETDTPPPPTSTFTPLPPTDTPVPSDTQPPVIQPGWIASPDFGPYGSCSLSFSIFNLEVIDPAFSMGLAGAWLKMNVNDQPCYITVSPSSSSSSCGGGSCTGMYDWTSINLPLTNYESTCSYTIPEMSISVKVWARAEDTVSLYDEDLLGEYILDSGCAPTAD